MMRLGATANAPTGLAASARGRTAVQLSWTAGAAVQGVTIDGYDVQYKLASASQWTTRTSRAAAFVTSIIVTQLQAEQTYDFRIRASASVGDDSAWTAPVRYTLPPAPNGVRNLSASPGDGSVTLTWLAPTPKQGVTVAGYRIQWGLGQDRMIVNVGSSTLTYTVSGLRPNIAVRFLVGSVSAAGIVLYRAVTATPSGTVPAANPPTGLAAHVLANGNLRITWTRPVAKAGITIDAYDARYKAASDSAWIPLPSVSASHPAVDIHRSVLMVGTTYDLAVRSSVSEDDKADSEWVSIQVVMTRPPQAAQPTSVMAVAHDHQIALSWAAGAAVQGVTIDGYDVQYKLASASQWTTVTRSDATALAETIGALANGRAYDFRVRTSASRGRDSGWVTIRQTPAPSPSASLPPNVVVLPSDGLVEITWHTPPPVAGVTVDGYDIWYRTPPDSGAWTKLFVKDTDDDGNPVRMSRITGLDSTKEYRFEIRASASVGTDSDWVGVNRTPTEIPPLMPTPRAFEAQPGAASVGLSWLIDEIPEDVTPSHFTVEYGLAIQTVTVDGRPVQVNSLSPLFVWTSAADVPIPSRDAKSYNTTISGLTNYAGYRVRIQAVASVGGPSKHVEVGVRPNPIAAPVLLTSRNILISVQAPTVAPANRGRTWTLVVQARQSGAPIWVAEQRLRVSIQSGIIIPVPNSLLANDLIAGEADVRALWITDVAGVPTPAPTAWATTTRDTGRTRTTVDDLAAEYLNNNAIRITWTGDAANFYWWNGADLNDVEITPDTGGGDPESPLDISGVGPHGGIIAVGNSWLRLAPLSAPRLPVPAPVGAVQLPYLQPPQVDWYYPEGHIIAGYALKGTAGQKETIVRYAHTDDTPPLIITQLPPGNLGLAVYLTLNDLSAFVPVRIAFADMPPHAGVRELTAAVRAE